MFSRIPCICVCCRACVLVLIQGSGGSSRPRGTSLAKPTQFFHIRHCNCSRWPRCLRLETHKLIQTHTHKHVHAEAQKWPNLFVNINQWCAAALRFFFFFFRHRQVLTLLCDKNGLVTDYNQNIWSNDACTNLTG